MKLFAKLGVDFEIVDHNIKRRFQLDIEQQKLKQIARQQLFMSLNENEFIDSFSLDEYHSYDEIYSYMKSLQNRNSSTLGVGLRSIGKTYEGRNIYVLTIGKEALMKKKILTFECNVHAREWVKERERTFF